MARRHLGWIFAIALMVLAAVYVAWLGFGVETTGDYASTFGPSMNALLSGHLGAFFNQLPDDGAGGSIILRAPGALAGKWLVGGTLATFRFGALECVLALGVVGLYLSGRPMADRHGLLARAVVVGLCVLSAAVLDAVLFGHPEEALGGALCVGAVLLSAGGRAELSGIAVGLAIVNKPWGILAVAPCLLAAPKGRVRLGATAVAVPALWFGADYLAAPAAFSHSLSALSIVAHPQELWWPLARLHTARGTTPDYFLPTLVAKHAREAIVLLVVPLSLPLARRRTRSEGDCLALLALLLLVRCLLDPSDHIYYHLPFVVALVAWETRTAGVPLLSLFAAGAFWFSFHTVAAGSLWLQFAFYVAVSGMLVSVLAKPALGLRPRRAVLPSSLGTPLVEAR